MTRMTDETFNGLGCKPYAQWSETDKKRGWLEAERARFEEARLLKETADKDAAIGALANALRAVRPASRPPGCWCPPSRGATGHSIPCTAANAALRLAGRLP